MKKRGLACGVLLLAAITSGICFTPRTAYALPTTWVLQNATLDDGGTVSGSLTIGPYGYLVAPVTVTSTAGTLLGGHAYSYSDPTNIVPGSPPAFGVEFHSATYDLTLHIEFENSLESSGVDPIVLSQSWECASFSCPGPDTGQPDADTRFFTAGSAVAAPEPGTLSLLALGGIGAIALRRRWSRRI